MIAAQPGWPAFVNTFHIAAISMTMTAHQMIQNIMPGP